MRKKGFIYIEMCHDFKKYINIYIYIYKQILVLYKIQIKTALLI